METGCRPFRHDGVTFGTYAWATELREEMYADAQGREVLGHVVMLDPEGNEFCVA